MAGAEARHLRGLTLVDYPEKDREPPTLLAALLVCERAAKVGSTHVRRDLRDVSGEAVVN